MDRALIVFVDTDVLLHADDGRDARKHAQARDWLAQLWTRRCGRVSTQVLNEYYANAVGKLSAFVSQGDARAEVRRYQHWKPWQIDHQTVETAWAIEARYQLSWWDALIVAAAQHQGCALLLSEDLPHGLRVGALQVASPFLLEPAWLDQPDTLIPT